MIQVATILLAVAAAFFFVAAVAWFSMRKTDIKVLRGVRGGTSGAASLNNEWVALNDGSEGAECGGSDGGGCD